MMRAFKEAKKIYIDLYKTDPSKKMKKLYRKEVLKCKEKIKVNLKNQNKSMSNIFNEKRWTKAMKKEKVRSNAMKRKETQENYIKRLEEEEDRRLAWDADDSGEEFIPGDVDITKPRGKKRKGEQRGI